MIPLVKDGHVKTGNLSKPVSGKMTVEEMAKKLNVATSALRAHARRYGISLCVYKISERDKYLCRELYKEGLAIHVIAQKMELSNRAVSSIVYSEY